MKNGFTLVELMIVITVISILAVISIPIYQSYLVRAQVTNVISHIDTYKTFINFTYSQQGSCPTQTEINQIYNTESINSYIKSATLTSPDKNSCNILFELKNNISHKIANKHINYNLTVSDNDSSNWTCTSTDIEKIYFPSDCQ